MKKKGFATSAILYTLLLLFLVLMVGILNNLQNKKTILDALKKDTIQALENGTVTDAILDQIGIINSKIVEIEAKINNYEANTYTKTEIDNKFHKIDVLTNVATSTTLKYTGVNTTIPANSYFCMTATAFYNYGQPTLILINSSDTFLAGYIAKEKAITPEYATYCGYVSYNTTYYIWAQYSNATNNFIAINGFYVSM